MFWIRTTRSPTANGGGGSSRALGGRPGWGRTGGGEHGADHDVRLLLLLLLVRGGDGVVHQQDVDHVGNLDVGDVVDLTDDQLEVVLVAGVGVQVGGFVVDIVAGHGPFSAGGWSC